MPCEQCELSLSSFLQLLLGPGTVPRELVSALLHYSHRKGWELEVLLDTWFALLRSRGDAPPHTVFNRL